MPAPKREIIMPSAARTTPQSVPLINNAGYQNLLIVFDWTVEAVTSTLTPSIDVVGEAAAVENVWTAAAGLTAIGVTSYLFGIGIVGGDFDGTEAVGFMPPMNCLFKVAVGDADSSTYSVEAHWF